MSEPRLETSAPEAVPPARPAAWEWLLLLEVLGLAAYLRWRWADFDLDDSFITYTYARSLAHGHGFAFAGQVSLGTTTPFYALLLAGPAALGVPIPLLAKGLGLAGALAGCVFLHLLVRDVLGAWAGLLAAALLAINARHALVSMSGMETSLYTAVLLGAFLAFRRERPVAVALLAAAACLLRPDGVLLVPVLALAHLAERRKVRLLPPALFLLPLAAWALYAWKAFGSPIPSSMTAKLAYPEYGSFRLEAALRALGSGLAPALPYLAAAGVATLGLAGRPLLPLAAWTALYLAAFTRAPNFGWYYVPPVPGLIVLLVAGLAGAIRVLRFRSWRPVTRDVVRVIAGLAAGAWLMSWTAEDSREHRAFMDRYYGREVTGAYHALALWLRDNTPRDARVGVPEVGYVGYYSGRPVLDLAGLCTPEVIPYLREGRYAAIVQDYRPRYLALTNERPRPIHNAITGAPWFPQTYRPIKSFPYRGGKYIVFERRERPRPVPAGDGAGGG